MAPISFKVFIKAFIKFKALIKFKPFIKLKASANKAFANFKAFSESVRVAFDFENSNLEAEPLRPISLQCFDFEAITSVVLLTF